MDRLDLRFTNKIQIFRPESDTKDNCLFYGTDNECIKLEEIDQTCKIKYKPHKH